jgi:hypothetical protein
MMSGHLFGRTSVLTSLLGGHWLPTPLTRIFMPYNPVLAVMKRVFRSLPPKQTLAVHGSGTAIFFIWAAMLTCLRKGYVPTIRRTRTHPKRKLGVHPQPDLTTRPGFRWSIG